MFVSFLPLASCNNNAGGKAPGYTVSDQNDTAAESGGLRKTGRGMEIFQQRCKTCHGITGNGQSTDNSTYVKAADLQISVIDSLSIANTIINGKGGMPMFDHSIADSDMAQLVMYVKSLRKS